jgi:hypothetical protein
MKYEPGRIGGNHGIYTIRVCDSKITRLQNNETEG